MPPTPSKKRKSKSLRKSTASRKKSGGASRTAGGASRTAGGASKTAGGASKRTKTAAKTKRASRRSAKAKRIGGGYGYNDNSVSNSNSGYSNSGFSNSGFSDSGYGNSNFGSNMNMSNNSQRMNNFMEPQFLFANNVVSEYNASVGSRIFIKTNVMFGATTILDSLPCQEYRHYMQSNVESKTIDYAFMSANGRITAIIFAELGECKEYPYFWTVRLICGRKGSGDARTLLGLYLYALKSIGQPVGILEVAGSYKNLGAYCMYAKFGFVEAYRYPDFEGCEKFSNMTMLRGMDDITKEDIVAIVHRKLVLRENKLCKQPINEAAQNARVRTVLLPKWDNAGYNVRGFYGENY